MYQIINKIFKTVIIFCWYSQNIRIFCITYPVHTYSVMAPFIHFYCILEKNKCQSRIILYCSLYKISKNFAIY